VRTVERVHVAVKDGAFDYAFGNGAA